MGAFEESFDVSEFGALQFNTSLGKAACCPIDCWVKFPQEGVP